MKKILIFICLILIQIFQLQAQCTFTNPIKSGNAPDPQVTYKDGFYYGCYTTGGDIRIWKNASLQNIFQGTSASVYNGGPDLWAPEIHFFDGNWYIYACRNSGSYWFHTIVLKANTTDPLGSYSLMTEMSSLSNTIDASPWKSPSGQYYITYSRMDGATGQEIWISKMSNPYTLQGSPVKISGPDYAWEQEYGNVNEGPQFIEHGSKIHIVYSASQCHYEGYKLGLLSADISADLTNASNWTKSPTSVFQKNPTNDAYAVGHHGCVQTPNGEWWLIYHGKYGTNKNTVNSNRDARLQQFTWNGDIPVFGVPVKTGTALACPGSGVITSENSNFWHFTTDLEGWNTIQAMSNTVSSSILTATITGADPYMHSPNNLGISATDYKYVVVGMQNLSTDNTAQLYWVTDTDGAFDGAKSTSFSITPNDTKQRYYIIDLSAKTNWKGLIKQIRFDPLGSVSSGTVKIDFIKFVGTKPSTISAIPGTIEIEDFDLGGQGNAYNETDASNNGGQYRTTEEVDIENCAEGGYDVGWTALGEWMEYLVNVSKTANYDFVLRTASVTDGNQFHLEVDGQDVSGVKTVNTLSGLQTYFDIKNTINLSQGKHVLKFVIDKANGGFNLNKMVFTAAITTGMDNAESSNLISVYPNPSNSILNVKLRNTGTFENIQLINATGEIVLSQKVLTDFLTIDIHNLSSGIYILKVGEIFHKIIITK